jgi:uncharacterized damage-inducible protein DinB
MTCTYHADLASSQQTIEASRRELLAAVDSVGRADIDRARKGGWTVRRVLEHVIVSERLYAQAVAYLCGAQASGAPTKPSPGSASEARTMLLDSRKSLLAGLEALELDPRAYETFYEVKKVGHEEYSVLSVLENVANHDREHAEQIRTILAADAPGNVN